MARNPARLNRGLHSVPEDIDHLAKMESLETRWLLAGELDALGPMGDSSLQSSVMAPVDAVTPGSATPDSDSGIAQTHPLLGDAEALVQTMPGDRRVFVRERLANGRLSDWSPLQARGIDWSPWSVGAAPQNLHLEYAKWASIDLPQIAALGVNVVRVYHDFGTGPQAQAVLDEFARNGLKVIVTVDSPRHGVVADLQNLAKVVQEYRNHPAILGWAVGNEWDLNFGPGFYYGTFTSLEAAAGFVEQAAQLIKSIDGTHPVTTFMADPHVWGVHPLSPEAFPFAVGQAYTSKIVNQLVPSIDIWGFNLYRGSSFGDAFQMWASISNKPMWVGEFGADSYDHRLGQENQAMQADFDAGLWDELYFNLSAERSDGVAVGGFLFSYNDEWWKSGNLLARVPSSEVNGGQPDLHNDEAWFGVTTAERVSKQAYAVIQGRFTGGQDAVVLDAQPVIRAISQGERVARSGAEFLLDNKTVFQRGGGAYGGRGVNVAVLDANTGIRMKESRNFDTWYSPYGWGQAHVNFETLASYLDSLPNGAVVMLAIGDEGGFMNTVGKPWNDSYVENGYQAIEALGSKQIRKVPYRGGWAMIAVKGHGAMAEAYSAPGETASVEAHVDLILDADRGRRPQAPQVLSVVGSNGADQVTLREDQGLLTLNVNGIVRTEIASEVSAIRVEGLDGKDALRVCGHAQIQLKSQQLSSLSIEDTACVSLEGRSAVRLGILSVQGAGLLDLADNDLIVTATPETKTAVLAALSTAIKSARGSDAKWTGTGLGSSAAKVNKQTGLSIIVNDKSGNPILTSFAGQSVGVNDILVKYTWNGDVNLDGQVDAADYFLVDSGFITQQGQYRNGDLNLDGVVDAADYFMIDSAFIGQTSELAAQGTPVTAEDMLVLKADAAKPQETSSVLEQLFSVKPVL